MASIGLVCLLREQAKQLEQERDASRDMLDSTRLELELLREAMGVPVEPHQSLSDRMLEAAKELKGKLDSTEQRLQRRMEDIQEQAKRYVTLESNCQAVAAQNEALRSALHKLACLGNGDSFGNSVGNCIAQDALNLRST